MNYYKIKPFNFNNENPEKVTDRLIPKGRYRKKSFKGSCDCISSPQKLAFPRASSVNLFPMG